MMKTAACKRHFVLTRVSSKHFRFYDQIKMICQGVSYAYFYCFPSADLVNNLKKEKFIP